MNKDSIGDRMKSQYENRTKYFLPRRTYTVIRLDGKAFHSFTKDLDRPYDSGFMSIMDSTAVHLCRNLQGAKFAYIQSDEISILLTDFETPTTQAYFDGEIQKIVSVSASLATGIFNHYYSTGRHISTLNQTLRIAAFDSRVFTIPDPTEVENYFIWRQQDATRNAIQMAGQAHFSHSSLQGISCEEIQEKLFQEKQVNFDKYPVGFKRGRLVTYQALPNYIYTKKDDELTQTIENMRHSWVIEGPPIFTKDREYLRKLIPLIR